MTRHPRAQERGNVFFYIFLGIALFGALSFAVSQGGQGSIKGLADEQSRLRATEIIDYTDSVGKAVGIMRLRGVKLTELSFANTGDVAYGTPGTTPEHEVFNAEGGGMILRPISTDALDNSASGTKYYTYTGNNAVSGVGTTCTASTCADLMILALNLKKSVCITINEMISIDNPSGSPPVDDDFDDTTAFTGTMGYSETIGDETSSAPVYGHTSGCVFNNDTGEYDYYKVLWTQ